MQKIKLIISFCLIFSLSLVSACGVKAAQEKQFLTDEDFVITLENMPVGTPQPTQTPAEDIASRIAAIDAKSERAEDRPALPTPRPEIEETPQPVQEEPAEPVVEEKTTEELIAEMESEYEANSIDEGGRVYSNYLFVGDSRAEGMSQYCPGEYIAKSSENIGWLKSNYDRILEYSGYNIVMMLGVNDLYNISNYISMYNGLPDDFVERNNIVIVSVNPCQGSYSHLNSEIDDFNARLQSGISSEYEYVDTNTYLNNIGFSTTDGLHYTASTYQDIYNYIVEGY